MEEGVICKQFFRLVEQMNNLPLKINEQTQTVRPACTILKCDWMKKNAFNEVNNLRFALTK